MKRVLRSFAVLLILAVAFVASVPIQDWVQQQVYLRNTYPWDFWIINASDAHIGALFTDGLDDPLDLRTCPGAGLKLGRHGWAQLDLGRVKRIPKHFTVRWRITGDDFEHTQNLEFPQSKLGSRGYYILELGRDGKWTITFDPDRNRELPRFDVKPVPNGHEKGEEIIRK